jgi:hypothetical protein
VKRTSGVVVAVVIRDAHVASDRPKTGDVAT